VPSSGDGRQKIQKSPVFFESGFFVPCVYLRLYLCMKRAGMFVAVAYLHVYLGAIELVPRAEDLEDAVCTVHQVAF